MKEYGQDLNVGGTSDINAWKMRIEAQTFAEPPVREFKPLKSWAGARAPTTGRDRCIDGGAQRI